MSTDVDDQLTELYPALRDMNELLLRSVLTQHSQHLSAPAGTLLFDEGAPCRGFPMVLSGAVRVARGWPGGRTLELYRVTPGEL
jgi:CRP/FNR family transcriptional regulator